MKENWNFRVEVLVFREKKNYSLHKQKEAKWSKNTEGEACISAECCLSWVSWCILSAAKQQIILFTVVQSLVDLAEKVPSRNHHSHNNREDCITGTMLVVLVLVCEQTPGALPNSRHRRVESGVIVPLSCSGHWRIAFLKMEQSSSAGNLFLVSPSLRKCCLLCLSALLFQLNRWNILINRYLA